MTHSLFFTILCFCTASLFGQSIEYLTNAVVNQTVNVITGELYEGEIDLSTQGARPLTLQRIFMPQDRSQHAIEHGWQFNYPYRKTEGFETPEAYLEYDVEGRLCKILEKESQNDWIHFTYSNEGPLTCLAQSHDGQKLQYSFSSHVTKNNQTFLLLEEAQLPSGQIWKYQYIEHPLQQKMLLSRKQGLEGRCTQTDYYTLENQQKQLWNNPGPLRTFKCGKVKSQSHPVGTLGELVQTQHLNYFPGMTEVYDALENKTVYYYNLLNQITSIQYFLKDPQNEPLLYRTERYYWDPKNLRFPPIGKSIEDAEGSTWSYQEYEYDNAGRLLKETLFGNLTGSNPFPIPKDNEGLPIVPGIESYSTTYVYEGQNLKEVNGENGISLIYSYEQDLLTAKFYLEDGMIRLRELYSYDESGFLAKVIVDDGRVSNPKSFEGVTEQHISYLYPVSVGISKGLPETIEEKIMDLRTGQEKLQKRIVHQYDAQSRLVRRDFFDEKGGFCFSEVKDYDPAGNLIYTSTPEAIEEKKFDSYQNVLYQKKVDASGRSCTTVNTYDLANRLLRQECLDSNRTSVITTYRYDAQGNKIATIDEFGLETFFEYDGLNRLIRTIYPARENENGELQNPIVTYTYDLFDRISTITKPNGGVASTSYNIRGKPIKIEHPDHSKELFEYSLDGSLKKWTMVNGCIMMYERDFLGRITDAILLDATTTELKKTTAHYSASNLQYLENSTGDYTHFQYDVYGKQIGEITSSQDSFLETVYNYEACAQLDSIEEWYGPEKKFYAKTIHENDSENNPCGVLIQNIHGEMLLHAKSHLEKSCSGNAVEIKYENRGGQILVVRREIDAQGNVTTSWVDNSGQLVQLSKYNTLGQLLLEQEFCYDLEGNRVRQKTQHGASNSPQTTEWKYDQGGHLIHAIENSGSPSQRVTSFVYEQGRLIKTIKPNGIELSLHYNERGLVDHISASDGSINYLYEYDQQNQITRAIDHQHEVSISRKYSASGQIELEESRKDIFLTNTYDFKGRKTQIKLPDNSEVNYLYNALYLEEIHRIHPDPHKCYKHHYSKYDLEGNLLTLELIKGLGQVIYKYDAQGRITEIVSPYFSQKAIQYDDFGNLTQMSSRDLLKDTHSTFTYDYQNQLINEHTDLNEDTYHYDSSYRCLSKNNDLYLYDEGYQLQQAALTTYTYDRNGNCISLFQEGTAEVQYQYDALDRLTEVSTTNVTVQYLYDGFNRRHQKIKKHYNTLRNTWDLVETAYFLYDGDQEIGEMDAEGKIRKLRILENGVGAELGAAIAIEIDNQVYAPLHDNRGNVCCLVNSHTGVVDEFYRYSAFGIETIYNQNADIITQTSAGNPWRFSSKRTDAETGFVYFGHRYYCPKIGRWLTPDPVKADSPNDYAYVNNNPMNHIDLYGLFALQTSSLNMYRQVKNFALQKVSQIKKSCTNMFRNSLRKCLENFIERPFFHLTGFYILPSEIGVHGRGESDDGVRVTLINGIMNVRKDFQISLRILSETHGGVNVHYVFRPTQGFFSDLVQAFMSKLGYASPHVRQLANMWRELIDEMGGPANGGLIMHYAHSLGGTDTLTASLILTPEERRMIRVFTIGSATMLEDKDFESVFNFVSKRDGIALFDPVSYYRGLFSCKANISFIGSVIGIPLIDHWLSWTTYTDIIKLLGRKFLQVHPSVD